MSAKRWIERRCDICEGDAFGGLRPDLTILELRAEAKNKGWLRKKDGRDICELCAALAPSRPAGGGGK